MTARRSCSPRSPLPAFGSAPADAVVGDDHDDAAVAVAAQLDARPRRIRVARDVGQRLRHDEVGGRLDRRRQAAVDRALHVDRDRRAVGERGDCGIQAAAREDRRMDAAGELAQLAQRGLEPHREPVDQRSGLGVGDRGAQHAQLEGEGQELLLGAVVEVALDAPAGLVGGLDDAQRATRAGPPRARAGRPSGARCRWPATTPPRRPRRARGSCPARRRGRSPPPRRPSCSTAVHARPDPGSGSATGMAGLVDERLAVGQPVGDRHRAVAEALGQQLAHRPAGRGAGRQQRAADRAQHGVERVERRDRRAPPPPGPARAGRVRGPGRGARGPGSRSCPGRRRPARRGSGSRPAAPAARARRCTGRRSAAAWWPAARPSATARGRRACSSERRHGLPVVAAPAGTGGMWGPRKRLAARRSSRTSRRQAAAAPSSSGSPIQATLSAAPRTSASTESAPRIAIGTLTTR